MFRASILAGALAVLLLAPLAAASAQEPAASVLGPVGYECAPCEGTSGQECSVLVAGQPAHDPLGPDCSCDYSCEERSPLRDLLKP